MKRKFTFFGICVLLCTLMISLGSCQKDYSEDIDDLQRQINENKTAVAALNQAIASGKLIKTVATVTGGYQITFSDNTTITINHGTTGATGATGPQGPAGTPGTPGAPGAPGENGFTPIIGVDADGYWTVITSQGGTPVRIKNASNEEILAQYSKDLGTTASGILTVGGVETTVYIPMIVYNEVTKQLTITLQNADKTFSSYTVAVSETTFMKNDLVSVLSPIGTTKVLISYGSVPSSTNAVQVNADATLRAFGLAWANKTYGDLLRSGGKMPIIINPANANLTGYTFEVIKSDGTLYGLQPAFPTEGYTNTGFADIFAQYAMGPSNGLYTLEFKPTLAQVTATTVPTEQTYLAVRATNGERQITSGFQYSIKKQADTEVLFELFSSTTPKLVKIGTTQEILKFYKKTSTTDTLAPSMFFKTGLTVTAGYEEAVSMITFTNAASTVATTSNFTTVNYLDGKIVPFKLHTFDWAGRYKENILPVQFVAQLNETMANINLGTITLANSVVAPLPALPGVNEVDASFTAMFNVLDNVGKTELWRTNANNVKITFYRGTTAITNPAAEGLFYKFLDINNNVISTANATLTDVEDIQKIRKVRYYFDETLAVPGTNYKAVFSFEDRRAYAAALTRCSITMPFVLANPDFSDVYAGVNRVEGLFTATGDTLAIYGTGTSTQLQGNTANWYYDLNTAFTNLSATSSSTTAPVLNRNMWRFDKTITTRSNLLGDTYGDLNNRFRFSDTSNTDRALPYVPYKVTLNYKAFGNVNNKVKIDEFWAVTKSEVKEGKMELIDPENPLVVTAGETTTWVRLRDRYRALDYKGLNLNVFNSDDYNLDNRIVPKVNHGSGFGSSGSVQILNDSPNAALIAVEWENNSGNSNDTYRVRANVSVAELTQEYVDVPVKVVIWDVLRVKTVHTIIVRVVKP